MGNVFPATDYCRPSKRQYALAIAAALKRDLAGMPNAIKLVMRWTGANERTVKNWISGAHGPSGESLITLAHHSHEVRMTMQQLAGCHQADGDARIGLIRSKLIEAFQATES